MGCIHQESVLSEDEIERQILITASIGGCLILATALALPPGVMVREWSSHIVAGEVVPPEETRTTEEESEPEQQEEPEKPEELEADYIPEQTESQETPEEKEVDIYIPADKNKTGFDAVDAGDGRKKLDVKVVPVTDWYIIKIWQGRMKAEEDE